MAWTPRQGAATPSRGYHKRSVKEIAMDVLNVTQVSAVSACKLFLGDTQTSVEIEKISCWLGGLSSANPFEFIGKRVFLGDRGDALVSDPRMVGWVDFYSAKVLAVHVGSFSDGIETSLLLRNDRGGSDDYVPVSRLTVLGVLL